MRKDAEEVARILENLRVLEAGFDAARATIRPGISELEVWAAMHAAMMANVGAPFALEGNFASGPRTLENEPQATNRSLEAGDVIFSDLYPIIDGYAADLTRSFNFGRPSDAQIERHTVLKNALAAGIDALTPGARACDVDRAVRSSIATALGGHTFPHHAGHALGLEGQQRPMLIPGDNTIIEPGMVIAIEPGAYLPDTGGMRVEGNYLVTETGCMSLSNLSNRALRVQLERIVRYVSFRAAAGNLVSWRTPARNDEIPRSSGCHKHTSPLEMGRFCPGVCRE